MESLKTFLCIVACAATLLATAARAQRDDALLTAATAEAPAVLGTLERLVNIETGTGDAEGLAAMANLLDERLRSLGATVTRHKPAHSVAGEILVARLHGRGGRRVMLMAHMDTVYVRGTLAKAPFRVEGGRAFGPGIADDKGGIAVILHALALLKASKFEDFGTLTVVFDTDEERGSVGSRDLLKQLAEEHDFVLSFEPTRDSNEVVILGTSGVALYNVTVKGKAAHAGVNPESGVNAAVEASDIILRTLDLDDRPRSLRFNWTIVKSGAVSNIIPDEAVLQANVRYATPEDLERTLQVLDERIAKKRLAGARIEVSVERAMPPFNANAQARRIVDQAISMYAEAGGDLRVLERTGGGTDAAWAAQSGRPVLETLGLPGFGYHSNQAEYIVIDSIPRRLYLAVRLLRNLAAGPPGAQASSE